MNLILYDDMSSGDVLEPFGRYEDIHSRPQPLVI